MRLVRWAALLAAVFVGLQYVSRWLEDAESEPPGVHREGRATE